MRISESLFDVSYSVKSIDPKEVQCNIDKLLASYKKRLEAYENQAIIDRDSASKGTAQG